MTCSPEVLVEKPHLRFVTKILSKKVRLLRGFLGVVLRLPEYSPLTLQLVQKVDDINGTSLCYHSICYYWIQHLPRGLLTSSSISSSNVPNSLWPPSSRRVWHRDIRAPFTLKVLVVFSISEQTAFLRPDLWLLRNSLRMMVSSSVARIKDDHKRLLIYRFSQA